MESNNQNNYLPFIEDFNREHPALSDWFSQLYLYGVKHFPSVDCKDAPLKFNFSHRHSFFELHFFCRGKESYSVNGKTIEVTDGDYLLIFPETQHCRCYYRADDDKYCVNFTFPPEVFWRITGINESNWTNGFLHGKITNGMLSSLHLLFDEISLTDENAISLLSCGLYLLFSAFFANIGRSGLPNDMLEESFKPQKTTYNSTFCENVKLYAAEHLNEAITLMDLEQYFHVSSRQINRRLRNHFGFSFSVLQSKLRLDKSKKLLCYTSKSVEDISAELGYESSAGFIRFFKKEEGFTPYQYRRSFLEGDVGKL